MRVLILCAGHGTRLAPLTEHLAKPAVPLLNVPLWGYPLQLIESLSPSELHINLHHLPETIKESFKGQSFNYPAFFHMERELLGSAGPLLHLKNLNLDDGQNVLLANGDGVLLTKDSKVLLRLKERHEQSNALATILAMPLKGAGSVFSGVWIDSTSKLKGIGTKAPESGDRPLHYASMILLSPRIYDYVKKDSRNIFTDVLLPAQKNKEVVQVHSSNDLMFFETGNLTGLLDAHSQMMHIISSNQSQWSLIDILDRFSPGWRNYQKNEIYRPDITKKVKFENSSNHLVLLSRESVMAINTTPQDRVIKIKGPSSVYGNNLMTQSLDGIYWTHIQKALLNTEELITL